MARSLIYGSEIGNVQVAGKERRYVIVRGDGSIPVCLALPLLEHLNREHGTGLTLVPYQVAVEALAKVWASGDRLHWIKTPCHPVNTFMAYNRYGTVLGDNIVFGSDYTPRPRVIQPTGMFKGEKFVTLVVEGLTTADLALSMRGTGQRALRELLENEGFEYLYRLNWYKDVTAITSLVVDDRLKALRQFMYGELSVDYAGTGDLIEPNTHFCRFSVIHDPYVGFLVLASLRYHHILQGMSHVMQFSPLVETGLVAEVPEADVARVTALLGQSRSSAGLSSISAVA